MPCPQFCMSEEKLLALVNEGEIPNRFNGVSNSILIGGTKTVFTIVWDKATTLKMTWIGDEGGEIELGTLTVKPGEYPDKKWVHACIRKAGYEPLGHLDKSVVEKMYIPYTNRR